MVFGAAAWNVAARDRWNEHSVAKVPALLVAMYSWLLLAGLECYERKS